jgi:hypothetical protein
MRLRLLSASALAIIAVAVGCSSDPTTGSSTTSTTSSSTTTGTTSTGSGGHDASAGPTLSLVSARDHLEDALLVPRSIAADADRIYLAGDSGRLHVLARDRIADFPELEVIQDTTSALAAVAVSPSRVFVAARDGTVRAYDKTPQHLALAGSFAIDPPILGSLVLDGGTLYVSHGQANVTVAEGRLFVAELNEGEIVEAFDATTLAPLGKTYGATFEQGKTVSFDLGGVRLGAVDDPLTIKNDTGFPALFTFPGTLALAVPGCCGAGVSLFDAAALTPSGALPITWANAVAKAPSGYVVGTEGGQVVYVDGAQPDMEQVVDLRTLTGHTGSEDIEIRNLWIDGFDDLVLAGSSWGNASSKSPTLPAFFVLELH